MTELSDADVFGPQAMSDADVFGTPTNQQYADNFRARANETNDPRDIAVAEAAEREAKTPAFMAKTDRVDQGLGDPFYALGQLGAHLVPDHWLGALGFPGAQEMDRRIADREQKYQADRAAAGNTGTDWYRAGGNFAATALPSLLIPGGTTLLGAIGSGAGQGALQGLATPVNDTSNGYWGQKVRQVGADTAGGAVAGGVTHGIASALGAGGAPKAGSYADAVDTLQNAGVNNLTPGQIAGGALKSTEDKFTSMPGLGDAIQSGQAGAVRSFNKAGFQKALDPLGVQFDGDAGREGLGKVYQAISDAYDDVLPNVAFKADGKFAKDIADAGNKVAFAAPATQDHFANLLKTQILPRVGPNGSMSGEAFKALEEQLGQDISDWTSAGGDQAKLGRAMDSVLDAFRSNLERNNPAYADQLKAANTAFSRYADLRRAVAATRNADGVFTPEGLWSAMRAGDTSAGKNVTAQGTGGPLQDLARAGLKVLGGKYQDSGTASRGMIGSLFKSTPAFLSTVASAPAGLAYTAPALRAVNAAFGPRSGQVAPAVGRALQTSQPALSLFGARAANSLFGY